MNSETENKRKWNIGPAAWAILAMVAVMAIANWARHSGAASGETLPPDQRKPMPSLAMADLNGNPWRLEDHRGKVVLVNYWATWCPPCQRETPDLVNIANKYADKGLSVVGISLDEADTQVVRDFAARYAIPYPILKPEPGSPHTAGITSIPVTLLLDRQGRVAKSYIGAVTEDQLSTDIENLLKETA